MHARFARWLVVCAVMIMLGSLPAGAELATPLAGDSPVPVTLPRDDGPHNAAGIEWWYFTGHLQTAAGERYGFEYVVFRARPGDVEGFVSHFAITDESNGLFRYDQRILGSNDISASSDALDLKLRDWTMQGGNGDFALYAAMPGYALDVALAATKPATLHDSDGYIDYGNGTSTYYYSWTRLQLHGTLTTDSGAMAVTGTAWMDHQWGDFLTYQQGGWDWFAVQLENGTDIMVYLVRGADGSLLRVDGSIVAANGEVTYLRRGDFSVAAIGEWRSLRTGTLYPSGWEITIPVEEIEMTVTPILVDQELDTRATTGVIYWEGASRVRASIAGQLVDGRAYVELTGYAPFEPPTLPLSATPAASS